MNTRDVAHCVLVIDDDADQRELIRDQLGPGVRMVGAGDGLEGYRLACAERPSAVVLDIAMPIVDGWTILRKLRSNPLTSSVPVIVISGLEELALVDGAKQLGVHSVFQKPYDADALCSAIAAAIRSSTSQAGN